MNLVLPYLHPNIKINGLGFSFLNIYLNFQNNINFAEFLKISNI